MVEENDLGENRDSYLFLPALRERGYSFATLSEALGE
jgi:hypothetical protein